MQEDEGPLRCNPSFQKQDHVTKKYINPSMIRRSLHPCFRGIPMPMCLLCTLLQLQHARALEYDQPWLIQHYIQIFNMLVFSGSSDYATHLHFL